MLYPKQVEVLLNITEKGNLYVSIIVKKVNCNYLWCSKTLRKFNKLGLVTFEKAGRIKYVYLTEKGKKLQSLYSEIKEVLKENATYNN